MELHEPLVNFAKKLGFPDLGTPGGKAFSRILELIFDGEDDHKILEVIPGTIEQLTEKSGLPEETVREIVDRLFLRGGITVPPGKLDKYTFTATVPHFKDDTVLWPDAPQEFYELWEELYRNEGIKKGTEMEEITSFLDRISPVRVLAVEETVTPQNRVLDIDSAQKIIKEAELITAVPCVCRIQASKNGLGDDCPAPEKSTCMQTNIYAERIIARGLHEILTNEEALERLEEAEKAGLVHFVNNVKTEDNSYIMCNCCSCCCLGVYYVNKGYEGMYAPSRFRVTLDTDACSGCGTCVDRCQFLLISMENGDDVPVIDADRCYGCGNCVLTCPEEAMTLEEARPEDFVGENNFF
ncbi:MAG: 4Fe-4S binding protein [Desulfobacteraceae bacterium]|nr:4Fe-4S binding protein [Desulfobacteraceae bacterium]